MLPHDTALSRFMRSFGDMAGKFLYENLYHSSLFSIILYIATIVAFILLAINVTKDEDDRSSYPKVFFMTLLLSLPYKGRPVGFVTVNAFSDLLANSLSDVVNTMFKQDGGFYPPGYVFTSIVDSAGLEYPLDMKRDIRFAIEQCTPTGMTNKEPVRPITPMDLFQFEGKDPLDGQLNFDRTLLASREATYFGKKVNCDSFHHGLINKMVSYAEESKKNTVENTNVPVMKSSKDQESTSQPKPNGILGAVSSKIAVANGWWNVTKELAQGGGGNELNQYMLKSVSDRNVIQGYYMRGNMYFSDALSGAKRGLGTTGVSDILDLAKEYREKMFDMPYLLSTVFILMQLSYTIVAFIPFITGNFKWVRLWSGAFISLKASVWLLVLARVVFNQIVLRQAQIGSMGSSGGSSIVNSSNMADLSGMTSEVLRMTENYLLVEKAILGMLLVGIPGSSLFVSRAMKQGKIGSLMSGGKGMIKEFGKATIQEGLKSGYKGTKDSTGNIQPSALYRMSKGVGGTVASVSAKGAVTTSAVKNGLISTGAKLNPKVALVMAGASVSSGAKKFFGFSSKGNSNDA